MKAGVIALLALFSCFLWGSVFPIIKIGYDLLEISSDQSSLQILFAGFRFTLGGIVILILYYLKNRSFGLTKEELKQLFILSLPQTFLQYMFFYRGMANTSGSNGSILSSMSAFFVVILAHFLYKDEKINLRKLLGVILGCAGIVVLNFQGGEFGNFSFTGEGYIILSGLFGACATVYTKRLTGNINPILLTGGQLFMGGSLLLTLAMITKGDETIILNAGGIAIIFYLAFVSATAFSIWSTLLKYNKASKISIYKFSIPVFGVMLSYFILAETNDVKVVAIAMLLVTAGIVLLNLNDKSFRRSR